LTSEYQKQTNSKKHVIGTIDAEIKPTNRGSLNYENKRTIEFRSFASTSDPHKNLEKLAKELGKVLGDHIVYDIAKEIKHEEQTQTLSDEQRNRKELYDALKGLGYDDQQISYAKSIA
jgi:hypothetical protein